MERLASLTARIEDTQKRHEDRLLIRSMDARQKNMSRDE